MTRRNVLLNEMGIGPVWSLRDKPESVSVVSSAVAPETVETTVTLGYSLDDMPSFDDIPQFDDVPPLDDIPAHFLESVSYDDDEPAASARPDVSDMNWDQLEQTIKQCTACSLCKGRTQAVPGVGDQKAAWLFVGEGPGYFEDQQGEPFVGASGKLLDNMLLAIGLKRGSNAYIANVVKCRPTDSGGKDRPPTPIEAAACRPFLNRQIELIQPKIIITLGRVASTVLLGTDAQTPLAVLRGKPHVYQSSDGKHIPLVATYHPAYLLRQLSEKRKSWEDLCLAKNSLSSGN